MENQKIFQSGRSFRDNNDLLIILINPQLGVREELDSYIALGYLYVMEYNEKGMKLELGCWFPIPSLYLYHHQHIHAYSIQCSSVDTNLGTIQAGHFLASVIVGELASQNDMAIVFMPGRKIMNINTYLISYILFIYTQIQQNLR